MTNANIDLQRKVRFRVKKEYSDNETRYTSNPKIKIGRFYSDFKDYIEYHPNASTVEMDTVIGTSCGKGVKCMLTLLFRHFNFMLIYLLTYKRSEYVTTVFENLKKILGIEEFNGKLPLFKKNFGNFSSFWMQTFYVLNAYIL